MTLLEEAQCAIAGDRQDSYGDAAESFALIAKFWSVILKTEVSAEQVGLCMIALKISRQMNAPKRDNLVDIAGYAANLESISSDPAK